MLRTAYRCLTKMPEIPCQFTGCDFKSVNDSEQVAIVMFNSHVMIHQGGTPKPSSSSAQKLPPIPRPEIRQDVSDEDWATFLSEWDHFKRCTEIPDERVSDHLYLCCEKSWQGYSSGRIRKSYHGERWNSKLPSDDWQSSRLLRVSAVQAY